MSLIVQKYGGTSVGTIDRIKSIAQKLKKRVEEGNKIVVVVSAMGKTTDELISLASEISENPPVREMDMLVTTGEQISISLLSIALQEIGVKAVSLTGAQAGMKASAVYGKARITQIDPDRVFEDLKEVDVAVIAGFQGINPESNDVVTLGRGGSDLSAVAMAASLKADVCEIFTDVDGVYTTDPRIVSQAKKLDAISYDEMLELASLGASVMQSRSIEVAKKFGVVIHVRSSLNNNPGTLIQEEDDSMEDVLVRGIAIDKGEAKITLKELQDQPGVAAEIFYRLAQNNVNVDMIIQNVSQDGKTDLSFTVKKIELKEAVKVLEPMKAEFGIKNIISEEGMAKLSIVGVGMKSHSGVAYKMFKILSDNSINIQMISTSEIKISVVIDAQKGDEAVKALHKAFDLE